MWVGVSEKAKLIVKVTCYDEEERREGNNKSSFLHNDGIYSGSLLSKPDSDCLNRSS